MTCLVEAPLASRNRWPRSCTLTGLSPRKTCWSRSMVTTRRCSVISLTVRVLGTLTSMPDCNTGAVIMKITSNTSPTSTSGVMLMSARDVCVLPLLVAKATCNLLRFFSLSGRTARRNLFKRVQQFAAEVIGCRRKYANAGCELVVGYDGRHSHEQSGGGGDERFGDAGSNSAQRRSACRSQAVEGINHTHHGAEETDKRAGGGDSSEPGEAALEGRDGFAGCSLGGALPRGQILRWPRAAGLALVGLVDVDVDLRQGAGFVVVGKSCNFLQAGRAAESIDKVAALAGGLAKGAHLAKDDGPRVEAGEEQKEQDTESDYPDIAHHLH